MHQAAFPTSRADRRIRIAHLVARLPVGGMEMIVGSLVRHAPVVEYDTRVWCLEEADPLGYDLRTEGYVVEELGRSSRRQPGLFASIARRLVKDRIDILHCHDELSWFYGTVAASLARSPRIFMSMHGRRRDISSRHLLEQRLLAWRTDTIIAVSEFLKRQLVDELQLADSHVEVIPNAIAQSGCDRTEARRQHARRLLGVPSDAVVVGSVGELSLVKNFDLALASVARARHTLRNLRFVLIGEGALAGSLSARANALGLADVVTFAGLRRDVPDLLPGLDVYVCSSHYEGTSLAILEAMEQATPVVATAVGGNPEIVLDGETGLLVPPGDAHAMAAAFVRLSGDAALRARLGERAAEFVRGKFHLDHMMGAYGRVWRRPPRRRTWRSWTASSTCGTAGGECS